MFLNPGIGQFDEGAFWRGIAQGDDPNLPNDPMAAERKRQADAFQATIAKPRKQIDLSPLQQRAGAGDIGAIDELNAPRQQDARRTAYYDFMNNGGAMRGGSAFGGIVSGIRNEAGKDLGDYYGKADQDSMKSLMQSLGIQHQNDELDTKRAEAGIKEFEQKISRPQRNETELQKERMRDDSEMKKALLAGKLSASNAESQEYAAAVARGDSPEALAALRHVHAAKRAEYEQDVQKMRSGNYSGVPSVGKDQRPAIPVANGKEVMDGATAASTAQKRTPEQELEDSKKASDVRQALVNEALGRAIDPKTGKMSTGSFDPQRVAETLSKRADSTTPEMKKYLAREIKNLGTLRPDEISSQAFRKYMDMSRLAGMPEGAGSFKIATKKSGNPFGTDTTVLSNQAIGQIELPENWANRINIGGFTDRQRQAHAANARSLSDLLEYLHGRQ